MSIRINSVYQDTRTGERFRVLDANQETDVVVRISSGSAKKPRFLIKPKVASFLELSDELATGSLLPVELPPRIDVPYAQLSPKQKTWADAVTPAFQDVLDREMVELCRANHNKLLAEPAQSLGITVMAAKFILTKILQAGGSISAAIPAWEKCGRYPAVTDRSHAKTKPTKQGASFSLSRDDIAKLLRGAREFLRDTTTWREAYRLTMEKSYAAKITTTRVRGEDIVELKPAAERPSYRQFYYHACKSLGYVERTIQRYGKDMFLRNHAGKPIGQAIMAEMPGRVAELDWTTTGMVVVRRGSRFSVGTLVVYVIVDVFTGQILSIYLTLGNGSVEEAARAALVCLEDKVELCKRYGIEITRDHWPAQHLPSIMRTDRGEINSWKSQSWVTGLGLRIQMTRSKFACDKGTVEAFNKKIKAELQVLGGSTKDYDQRGVASPHLDGMYDFDQVYGILLNLAVLHNATIREQQPLSEAMVGEDLHHRPTPNALWDYAERHGMLRNFPLDEARIQSLPFNKAAVTSRGIQIQKLQYQVPSHNPDEAGGIIPGDWLAEAGKKRWQVNVGLDEATVDHIWLRHAPQGAVPVLLKCPLAPVFRQAYGGLSWPEFRAIDKEARQSRKAYLEVEYEEAKAVHDAYLKRVTLDARALTDAGREGISKAALTRNIPENRLAEKSERLAAAKAKPARKPARLYEDHGDTGDVSTF